MLIAAGETLMFLKTESEDQAFTRCLCLAGGVICASVPLKCLDVSHRIP